MSALGSLVVKLALEYAEYTKGLNKSDQESLKFAQNIQRNFDRASETTKSFFTGVVQGAVAAIAAYVSVGRTIEGLNSSIDTLAKLDDMSQKYGTSVESLSKLQKVASTFGQDFNVVDAAIAKLSQGMAQVESESNRTHKALAAVGLSSKDAAGKLRDPALLVVDLARKLQDYEDGAAKAALVTDLFGKSGAELLPYLNDLAANVDKFSGDSAEAATKAADFQDRLGFLKVRVEEVFTSLAIDLLPSMSDFIDAIGDVKMESDKLSGDSALSGWMDDLAVGLARVIDVAKLLPGVFRAVGGSFEVVGADIDVLAKKAATMNPLMVAQSLVRGDNPFVELAKAKAERNKTLAETNARYAELWDKPANQYEQAMLDRIAARQYGNVDQYLPDDTGNAKKGLSYTSGTAAKTVSEYDKLIRSIKEKIAAEEREAELGRPLTEGEKLLTKVISDRASGAIKLTDAQMKNVEAEAARLDVLDRVKESHSAQAKMEKERTEAAQKEIATAFESIDRLQHEVDTYGLLPSVITDVTLAKLAQKKASLELSGEAFPDEIAKIDALIEANRRLGKLQGQKEFLDEQKKAAEESGKVWDDFAHNVQRNLGDTFFNAMQGKFDGIGASFRALLQRMLADALAAKLSDAMFGGTNGGSGLFSSLINAGIGLLGGGSPYYSGGAAGATWTSGFDLNAKGNAFLGGRHIKAFAEGGAFTNSIATKPTFAPMALFGEAGPEAIMPLTRGADGKLGVHATGGGKQMQITYSPTIQIDARSDQAQVRQLVDRAVQNGNAQLVERMKRERVI